MLTTITRTVTVAAGRFAPGHLGELTAVVPFELVDAVLAETRAVQRRLRDLPSRVGVYFLLAMCLFPEVGYRLVWDTLTAGLSGMPVVCPSAKALRDLRRRIGSAPVRALFEVLAGLLARPTTPGARFGPYRMVSFDGCSSLRVPDSERNRAWLGRTSHHGYPTLELMTLIESGTRALVGAVFGPTAEGETSYARRLLHLLRPDMLVLWDKGFDSNVFLSKVTDTGAQVLGRLRSNRRTPVLTRLTDGSYLSAIGTVKVRVIDTQIAVTCADGTSFTGSYRLVTPLTDARRYPATSLVGLYHQRWEHESAYYALRHTIMNGRNLRSGDPAGIEQECGPCSRSIRPGRDASARQRHLSHEAMVQGVGGSGRSCEVCAYGVAERRVERGAVGGLQDLGADGQLRHPCGGCAEYVGEGRADAGRRLRSVQEASSIRGRC
ncbi:IS4 family transposase [Streptomyces umbrinus]|uniref:IS4 family transposase n=1 Tax=Streptomyces umbrinus TaxID=67370 RepID=UPI0027D773EF|nr:IS4 family transposase [Streptomyces umbrinus]